MWNPGEDIDNGRYTLTSILGGGGFGITYNALDNYSQKSVAIKILNRQSHQLSGFSKNLTSEQIKQDFDKLQRKFRQEALTLSRCCQHPHIVKIYDVIFDRDLWGMVMEYIEGRDLSHHLDDRGRFSESEALKYIDEIAQALEHVHQQNLLHLDIKPHNIILRDRTQESVLIDFGLAREYDLAETLYLSSQGTPYYAPLEQYEKKGRFGPHTDIYSLAATLYHLLTGEPPALAITHQYQALKPPKELNSAISDRVSRAVIQGVAMDAKQRPQNMTEFRRLLGLLPEPVPPRTPKPHRQVENKPRVSSPQSPSKLVPQKFSFETAKLNWQTTIEEQPSGLFGWGKKQVEKTELKIVKQTKQGKYIIEDLGNGVQLEMVSIPGGRFMMGSPAGEGDDSEKPQHLVNVPAFYMGKYPITQSQYLAVMGNNPSHFQGGDLPVERVSWLDAQEFCQKLSKKTGTDYRLPSEAEWEYAARAGTKTPFHFGETITTDVANFDGNNTYGNAPRGKYLEKTTPVGYYKVANDFGLYDMHGNVREWCLDEWIENYNGAPTDGSARGDIFSRDKNKARLLRGCSWNHYPWSCRSAYRYRVSAVVRLYNIGFRVVFPQTL